MRLLIAAAAIATAVALPAVAQETLAEQVAAARQTYMSGLTSSDFREGGYFGELTRGLDGRYVELSSMIDEADAVGIRRQQDALCGQNPFIVTVTPPFGIFITRGASEKIQYTYTGGATFVPALDVIGFSKGNPSARGSAATDLLKRVAEPVSIWRPSADVFVITGRDIPDMFVRCPGGRVTGPIDLLAPEPDSPVSATPLEVALGATFDKEFGSDKPVARQAFIDCAAPVFTPLPPDDLKLVIDTGFAPAGAARQRLEDENPGLSAALGACAQAASDATE